MPLLTLMDPAPAVVEISGHMSPFVFVCEHAGLAVPRKLGDLGITSYDWTQHIAYDIGAVQVARHVARKLKTTLIFQQYSRLVIDCNRTYGAASLIPANSHGTEVPGNKDLDHSGKMDRINEIHTPFHMEIDRELEFRRLQNIPTILVSIHSFTPELNGDKRPWHVGVQYAKSNLFASMVMDRLREDPALCVGDNQPWPVNETDDYTIPVHGDLRGIPYAMIEVRQDLIADQETQRSWGDRLSSVFEGAAAQYLADASKKS